MVSNKRPPIAAVVAVSKCGSFAAVAQADGAIATYDVKAEKFDKISVEKRVPISALALFPKQAQIAAYADRDGSIFSSISATAKPVACLPRGPRPVSLDVSEDILAAVGGATKEVILMPLDRKSYSSVSGKRRAFEVGHLHRNAISALALAPDDSAVVVCCQAVTYIDAASGQPLRRYTGHQTPVTTAAFLPRLSCFSDTSDDAQTPCDKFITSCVGDHFLSLWNAPISRKDAVDQIGETSASHSKKRRKDTTFPACHSFVAPEKGATSIVFDKCDEESEHLSFAALLPSGSVAVWRKWNASTSAKTTKPTFVVRPASADTVLFACFAEKGILAVARGHPLRPQFFTLKIESVTSVEVHMPPCNLKGLLVSQRETEARERSQRSLAVAEAKAPLADKESAFCASKGSTMNGVARPGGSEIQSIISGHEPEAKSRPPERPVDESEDEDDKVEGELSLQEKLAAVEMGIDSASLEGKFGKSPQRMSVNDLNLKDVGSLSNILLQAIHSKDDNLFDSVVENSKKPQQISQTVARLPAAVATREFLDMLASRVADRPGRAPALIPWIRQVLLEHAGALLTLEKSVALQRLIFSINSRAENLPALSRLEGKLELVVAQADRVRAVKSRATGNAKPAVEYIEVTPRPGGETFGSAAESDKSESGDEEDEEETGDFSEDDSDSSTWENDDMDEDLAHDRAGTRAMIQNGKAKPYDKMDMSDSDSDAD